LPDRGFGATRESLVFTQGGENFMHQQRVVITGLGILAPNGCGKETFWQACLDGLSGVRTITRFDASLLPTRIAGDIPDFSPHAFGLTEPECSLLDRGTQYAIAATTLALEDGGLAVPEAERSQVGVYLGTAMASVDKGVHLWQRFTQHTTHSSETRPTQDEFAALISTYVPSAAVAAHHDLRGPCLTLSTGCSSGADAIGQAFWQIQQGHVTRMLAGGSDSALTQLGLGVFSAMHAMSTRNEEPARASRPYDSQRDGFVLAEGAAVLLLEERELALARGAHVYAEIVGFASNSNAYHMTSLPADGAPLQMLLQQIMAETALSPQQIGYINSHGSSTPLNDTAETAAYKGIFGSQAYQIPISATKSLIGHTQGAASAIEALVTALAIDRQILPPTINLEQPDPACDLDYVPNVARPLAAHQPLRFALTHSSGFGGINTALVLTQHSLSPAEARGTGAEEQASRLLSTSSGAQVGWSSRSATLPRRVVITGLGTVAPNGIGTERFWQATRSGRPAIEPFASPSDLEQASWFVGRIKDFRVEDALDRKLVQRTDRMTHLVLMAVQEALQDAKLTLAGENPSRIGAIISNTLGGLEFVARQVEQLYQRGPRFISAYTAIAWLHVANVGQISLRYGLQGYCKTPVNDTCGGLDALGMAYDAIRRGSADVLITGGTEAPLHPYTLHMFGTSLPLARGNSPAAYRPFDLRAEGGLLAEGAGICILEEYEHALRRGAPIYGEVVGYAQTNSPRATSLPGQPDLAAYTRALQLALTEAQLTPEEIACVYLDGRALPAWDAVEADALHEVFQDTFETLACSIPRTQFGHSLAAAGALDTICALLSLRDGFLPPTLNCEQPDPRSCPPGLVRAREQVQNTQAQAALICARALGGSHVVLAVKKL
jgi:3-oxoacyl-(acyl-carrier-protein) synthase